MYKEYSMQEDNADDVSNTTCHRRTDSVLFLSTFFFKLFPVQVPYPMQDMDRRLCCAHTPTKNTYLKDILVFQSIY